jgi:iron complex transport system ATP-binding protein
MDKLELKEAGIKIEDRWLIRHISLKLPAGQLTALAGPNGSGKSTALKLLAGIWQPTEGQAFLNDQLLNTFRQRELARHISFIPQDTHITFSFTTRDVVAMGRHPHLGRFELEREQDQQAIREAMVRADILHLADRRVTELSGGERQRVVIARSLATQNNIILLDEPTANLDISHTIDVLNLCYELANEGKVIAIALHDLNAAARYAHHIVLLSEGRIVKSGAPSEVLIDDIIRGVFNVNTLRASVPGDGTMLFFYKNERLPDL